MGLVNWFICNLENPDTVLARDMMTMAVIDGEFTTEEKDELLRICQEEHITNTELWDALRGTYHDLTLDLPKSKEDRLKYVCHLINIMEADDYCSPLEIHALIIIARRFGISIIEIIYVLLGKVKDGKVEERREFKILESFVENYISIDGYQLTNRNNNL